MKLIRPLRFLPGFRDLGAAGLGAMLLAVSLAGTTTPPAVKDGEHVTIYREPGQYSAFPVLYQLPEAAGTLYVRFGAGVTSSHLEPRREQIGYVSTDGGRTWRRHAREGHNPAWQSVPGRLVVPAAHAWRYVDKAQRAALEARGIEVRNSPDGRVTYAYGCHVRISEDGGATWQDREIEVPAKGLIMGFTDPATYLRLDRRTILCAVYGRPTANERFYESWLLRTEDDGATWQFLTIAADPKRKRSFGETALVQAANGDIVAMMRTEPALGTRMWTTRSTDQGRTWSQPVETPLHGHPAHLLRLHDGTLLCTFGFRDAPIGIRAAFSHDHGQTWPEADIVTLRADGSGRPGDNGYPLSAELADGTLVSVYYLTRDGITGIEATRWTRPPR